MKLYSTTLFFALLFLSYSFTLKGEVLVKSVFTGLVVDSLSQQPIEYVSVALYKGTDNTFVSGAITNSKGEYNVILLPGIYTLKSSFVGYKTLLSGKTGCLIFSPYFRGFRPCFS